MRIALVAREVRALEGDLLVPVEPEPGHPLEDRAGALVAAAGAVRVLDAEEEGAAGLAGEEPVEEGRARAADVEVAGGGGGEAEARGAGHGAGGTGDGGRGTGVRWCAGLGVVRVGFAPRPLFLAHRKKNGRRKNSRLPSPVCHVCFSYGDGGIRTLDRSYPLCRFSKPVPSASRPHLPGVQGARGC